MKHKQHVLFVCTGNQCRSPAAEVMFKTLAREAGLAVTVESVGTHAWDGVPAQPATVQAASLLGYDLTSHESRPVTKALLERADVVLAMAEEHVRWLADAYPEDEDRVHLFRRYCEGKRDRGARPTDDIPDPVGQPLAVHEACLRAIETLLKQLVERWKNADDPLLAKNG